MRTVIAGGSGFLGGSLSRTLAAAGHEVRVLSRSAPRVASAEPWSDRPGVASAWWSGTAELEGWASLVNGADAVVNLAGESIAEGRWTDQRKRQLEDSRIASTRAIGMAMAASEQRPRVLVNASAIGYYGSRGDEVLTESSPPGDDFLGRLAVRWEDEAARAAGSDMRLVLLRTGIVLARDGGALAKMITPFRLFAGGPIGSGRQYMSWIHLGDWTGLVLWLLEGALAGPVNATAPAPVPNAEFARELGVALRRPSFVPTPAVALRITLGEMADALLLGGQRVVPARALEAGFRFRYPALASALDDLLGRSG